jgi:hypothetical protein
VLHPAPYTRIAVAGWASWVCDAPTCVISRLAFLDLVLPFVLVVDAGSLRDVLLRRLPPLPGAGFVGRDSNTASKSSTSAYALSLLTLSPPLVAEAPPLAPTKASVDPLSAAKSKSLPLPEVLPNSWESPSAEVRGCSSIPTSPM